VLGPEEFGVGISSDCFSVLVRRKKTLHNNQFYGHVQFPAPNKTKNSSANFSNNANLGLHCFL
jgi:hypothetical protein